jgi:hypothetical protein
MKLPKAIQVEVTRWKRNNKIRQQQKKFKRACKLADDKHLTDNKTYYVIQGNGFYKVWNSDEILRMKRQGIIKKEIHCLDIFEKASYVASSNKALTLVSLQQAKWKEHKRINEAL